MNAVLFARVSRQVVGKFARKEKMSEDEADVLAALNDALDNRDDLAGVEEEM